VYQILILDDDRETCRFIQELLARPDREFVATTDPQDALATIRRQPFDLLISDINLNAHASGLDLLRAFKAERPSGQVVLISGFGTLETAIEAVRAGAFDYISKPFNVAEVKGIVDRALQRAGSSGGVQVELPDTPPAGLVGRTAPMLDVYKQIAHAADSSAPVLVCGESGTGKELVARAIHAHSRRARDPFVAINCGAIAETLLESELFGHARGAFTGAVADTKGLFEQAGHGTILLDEIGETSPALQVRLLRVLEQAEVRPVGASRVVRVDARVVAATNIDLGEATAAGKFRQDLFYRLSVIVIRVPPLRDRRADIPLLVSSFLDNACGRARRRVTISEGALAAFMQYSWPGNVRELQNTVERLVVFSRSGIIDTPDLPAAMQQTGPNLEERLLTDLPTLDELERRYLVHILDAVGGNRTRAAEVMGIDRRTLYRMAERFGVDLEH
jgi:DNA-binding NtrC family response regulator